MERCIFQQAVSSIEEYEGQVSLNNPDDNSPDYYDNNSFSYFLNLLFIYI